MDLKRAREIYQHPKGHTVKELANCLVALNNSQEIALTGLQFSAIADAHNKLGIPFIELSQCQKLCIEDCIAAQSHNDSLSIVGICPQTCSICLYNERFVMDDASWIPQPNDPQYHHWETR